MRLTDLVRDENGGQRKRKAAPAVSAAFVRDQPQQEPQSETVVKQSGFLHADDLSAIYDLSTNPVSAKTDDTDQAQIPAPPPVAPQAASEPSAPTFPEAQIQPNEYPQAETVTQPVPAPPQQAAEIPDSQPEPQPELDNPAALFKNTTPAPAINEEYEKFEEMGLADALHIELLSLLDDIYEDGREGRDIFIERLVEPLAKTIDHLRSSNALLRKAVRLKKGGRSFTSHSLNVAILAIKLGIVREYGDERIFSLALCGMLGDIGMTRVDPAILNKKGKLTKDEFMEIKRHVDYSAEMLLEQASKFPFLAPIVYQIHERENGSGYPQGIKGASIHEFSKITGMCDVYIALTEPKANRENYSGYVAMQQIISRRGIDFDAKVIKSLIDVLSVFPLESLVKLNNSAIGRVIDISNVHPTRPRLSILINSDGELLKRPTFLDLEKEPLLYIEGPDIEEGILTQ